ncbi:hypothetical protein FGO68_gene11282 [Halteria grandinella]|uniref:Uncharacterized protein n=1 Tax=Halteria grandinella TaxID=5974 RepID=A0A8J8P2D5_HALGN|nr:hypothetical protein FGO68_gene11282 [Halteria grandinella]
MLKVVSVVAYFFRVIFISLLLPKPCMQRSLLVLSLFHRNNFRRAQFYASRGFPDRFIFIKPFIYEHVSISFHNNSLLHNFNLRVIAEHPFIRRWEQLSI